MKTLQPLSALILGLCLCFAVGAPAQVTESARVLSATPIASQQSATFQVVYEYAGQSYSVELPQDPGPTLQVQVTPVPTPIPASNPASSELVQPNQATVISPTYVIGAPVVTYPSVVYGGVYYRPLPIGMGHRGWRGGHRHR